MNQVRIRDLLANPKFGETVVLNGWVRTRRDSRDLSFLEVNDGSNVEGIQVVVDAKIPGYETTVLQAGTGSSVSITGEIVRSEGKGQTVEIRASAVTLVGSCDQETFPLQKKRHSFEFLRTIAHLRPRTNTFGAVFRTRSTAAFAVHKFFHERGFVLLHSPIITASDCEGAGAMFRVTTLNASNPPRRGDSPNAPVDWSKDFFEAEAFLTVSGQLEGELFATAFKDIYTFGPTFRAENSNTPRHLAEFWMIEPEMAFCDLEGNARIAEDFIRFVLTYVLEHCESEMNFFDRWIEKGIKKSIEDLLKSDFARMDYSEAIDLLLKSGKSFEYPVKWGVDLQTEHERYLTEEYLKKPVFVLNYPKEIKAFYMRANDDGRTVRAMDLLFPRIGEIIGGSQREEREDVLKRRIQESGLKEESYSWYLETRRFGTVPHSGFGLGFERLLMFLTGMTNIRDVIPFPRTPGNAAF